MAILHKTINGSSLPAEKAEAQEPDVGVEAGALVGVENDDEGDKASKSRSCAILEVESIVG